jgi:hypothetical protein
MAHCHALRRSLYYVLAFIKYFQMVVVRTHTDPARMIILSTNLPRIHLLYGKLLYQNFENING